MKVQKRGTGSADTAFYLPWKLLSVMLLTTTAAGSLRRCLWMRGLLGLGARCLYTLLRLRLCTLNLLLL
jgi:hypothetical protein